MAIIESYRDGDDQIELRMAGQTRRLYRNGVLHSEFNPRQVFTGSVWDLLALPVLFLPEATDLRLLSLGVGGASSLLIASQMREIETVMGVELDTRCLQLAQQHFGVKQQQHWDIRQGDGVAFARQYTGPRFDCIIDDMFTEADGEPVRVQQADQSWLLRLSSLLSERGILVLNFPERFNYHSTARLHEPELQKHFARAFSLQCDNCENYVVVYTKMPISVQEFNQSLAVSLAKLPRQSQQKLKFRFGSLYSFKRCE